MTDDLALTPDQTAEHERLPAAGGSRWRCAACQRSTRTARRRLMT